MSSSTKPGTTYSAEILAACKKVEEQHWAPQEIEAGQKFLLVYFGQLDKSHLPPQGTLAEKKLSKVRHIFAETYAAFRLCGKRPDFPVVNAKWLTRAKRGEKSLLAKAIEALTAGRPFA